MEIIVQKHAGAVAGRSAAILQRRVAERTSPRGGRAHEDFTPSQTISLGKDVKGIR